MSEAVDFVVVALPKEGVVPVLLTRPNTEETPCGSTDRRLFADEVSLFSSAERPPFSVLAFLGVPLCGPRGT